MTPPNRRDTTIRIPSSIGPPHQHCSPGFSRPPPLPPPFPVCSLLFSSLLVFFSLLFSPLLSCSPLSSFSSPLFRPSAFLSSHKYTSFFFFDFFASEELSGQRCGARKVTSETMKRTLFGRTVSRGILWHRYVLAGRLRRAGVWRFDSDLTPGLKYRFPLWELKNVDFGNVF